MILLLFSFLLSFNLMAQTKKVLPPSHTKTAQIEVNLGSQKTVKYIILQEYIQLGQRVKSFSIEIWKDGIWQSVANKTTIGYKRIIKIAPEKTDKIRINILDAKACPVLSNVEVY